MSATVLTIEYEVKILPDGRMNTVNTSKYVGLKPKTLAMMRCQGRGPKFIKLGSRVYYFQEDLDEWLNSGGKFQSTIQAKLRN